MRSRLVLVRSLAWQWLQCNSNYTKLESTVWMCHWLIKGLRRCSIMNDWKIFVNAPNVTNECCQPIVKCSRKKNTTSGKIHPLSTTKCALCVCCWPRCVIHYGLLCCVSIWLAASWAWHICRGCCWNSIFLLKFVFATCAAIITN